jgi:cytochrome c biogenesis protein CcdA
VLLAQGLFSPVPWTVRVVAAVLAGAAIALLDLATGECRLPQTRRQIPASLIDTRQRRGAFGFGFALGTGMLTYLPSCAPHVLVVALVLRSPSVVAVGLAACAFGAGRGLTMLLRAMAVRRDRFEERVQAGIRWLPRVAALVVWILVVLEITRSSG